MVLSCFVWLQVLPTVTLKLDKGEVDQVYWLPCSYLMNDSLYTWQPVSFDIMKQLVPLKWQQTLPWWLVLSVNRLVGGFSYYGIPVPGRQGLPIWGLTLWMTLDFIGQLHPDASFKNVYCLRSAPRYSSWDVDLVVKVLCLGKQPMETFIHRSVGGLGIPILIVVRLAAILSIVFKGWTSFILIKWIRSRL